MNPQRRPLATDKPGIGLYGLACAHARATRIHADASHALVLLEGLAEKTATPNLTLSGALSIAREKKKEAWESLQWIEGRLAAPDEGESE